MPTLDIGFLKGIEWKSNSNGICAKVYGKKYYKEHPEKWSH